MIMDIWNLVWFVGVLFFAWVIVPLVWPDIKAQYKRAKQDINRSWESRNAEKKEDAAQRERIAQAELRTEELRAKRLGHE